MGSIYQLTFFLAVALLAIVITVFVLAVSLLGRAIKMAAEEQEKTAKEQKDATENEIVKIESEIKTARETGELNIKQLENRLRQMKRQQKKHERRLKQIEGRPRLLRAKSGAIIPGIFFLASSVFSGVALGLVGNAFATSLCFWSVAIITIGLGVYLICQSLRVIERVAITSEETALMREKETFKTALREFEEEKKPTLEFRFRGQRPPFHVKAASEIKLEFAVAVERGDVADNVYVGFYLPPGFSFPGRQPLMQNGEHPTMPNFVSARVDYGTPIVSGAEIANELVIKAPPEPGQFEAYYRVMCRGFTGENDKFEIVVE